MNALANAAKMHKRQFEAFLARAGVEVSLLMPATKGSDGDFSSDVFGNTNETDTEPTAVPVTAVFSADYLRPESVVPGDAPEAIAVLGEGPEDLDAVLRVKLEDVLLTAGALLGHTLFDKCMYVGYLGQTFKVTSTKRTGLPPIGPYILWVGLTESGK